MTEPTTSVTPPQPTSNGGNFWNRRSRKGKILIIVGGVILALAIIGALVPAEQTDEGGRQASPAAQDAPAEEETAGDEAAKQEADNVAEVGESLSLKGTSYRVESVTTRQTVGSDFTSVTADGVFVVVTLTLTNEKNDPRTILADNVRLVGGNGNEYSTDSEACLAFENSLCILQEIQPDLPKSVVAVYDIPASAVAGAKLRAKDLFSNDYGEIELGL